MRSVIATFGILLLLATASGTPAGAQQCNDFLECTQNDLCVDGQCIGSAISGGSCDDGNPCTINDQCTNGVCTGTPAPVGTTCGDPQCAGTCGAQGFCLPDPEKFNQPCEDAFGACTTDDRCIGSFCFGTFISCPDSDNNPCTFEFCDVTVGHCRNLGTNVCDACETCDQSSGDCVPVEDGRVCDDGDECTGDGECLNGMCEGAAPVTTGTPGATTTPTPPGTTPTPGAGCVGDCDGSSTVTVDEIIRGVNIALGTSPVNDCPSFDSNNDGQVTVDELLQAVNAALMGC